MKALVYSLIPICLVGAILAPDVFGHVQLGTPLKKRYNLRSISCVACHQPEKKQKSKDELTAFGSDIAKLLDGKMVSERIAAAKELSRQQRKEVLDAIEKEYVEALEKLDTMKTASGRLYSEAIPAGDIEGAKPR